MSHYDPRRVAGHLLRRCLRLHDTIFARLTAGHEITPPQLAALVQIAEHPHIELSTLSELIASDSATIGGIIDRLEAKALVQRTAGTRDRRKKHVTLTKAGHALLAAVEPKALRIEDVLLAELAPDEREQFLDLLCRITGFDEAASGAEHVA